MKQAVLLFFVAGLAMILSACQGFLEDYDYKPLGTGSSPSSTPY